MSITLCVWVKEQEPNEKYWGWVSYEGKRILGFEALSPFQPEKSVYGAVRGDGTFLFYPSMLLAEEIEAMTPMENMALQIFIEVITEIGEKTEAAPVKQGGREFQFTLKMEIGRKIIEQLSTFDPSI